MYRQVTSKEEMMMNFYIVQRKLGEGAFGEVFQVLNKETGEEYALKSIDKSKLTGDDLNNIQLEIEIMSQVDHVNIVRTYEVFDEQSRVHIIMELMRGGELFERIVEKECYSEKEAACVIRPVIEGIKYCHEMGIVHRDLKPENLLYSEDGPGGIIKISDFGFARFYDDELMTTACGTPGYVAPEILFGRGYGLEVDYWSLGVILYIMLCGFPPFQEDTNEELFDKIKTGRYDFPSPYWDDISDPAKDLVMKCMKVNPNERITAEDMLSHEWIVSESTPRTDMPGVSDNIRKELVKRRFKKVGNAALASTKLLALRKASNFNK